MLSVKTVSARMSVSAMGPAWCESSAATRVPAESWMREVIQTKKTNVGCSGLQGFVVDAFES